jgi:hypothetical protein
MSDFAGVPMSPMPQPRWPRRPRGQPGPFVARPAGPAAGAGLVSGVHSTSKPACANSSGLVDRITGLGPSHAQWEQLP